MPRDYSISNDPDRRRRDALIWFLRFAHGVPFRQLGELFGLSVLVVRMKCRRVARSMSRAANTAPTAVADQAWHRRLVAAGAIPAQQPTRRERGDLDVDRYYDSPRYHVDERGAMTRIPRRG